MMTISQSSRQGAPGRHSSTDSGAAPIVTITGGRIRGLIVPGGYVFRGLPYAAPPLGTCGGVARAPGQLAGRPGRHPLRAEQPAAAEPRPDGSDERGLSPSTSASPSPTCRSGASNSSSWAEDLLVSPPLSTGHPKGCTRYVSTWWPQAVRRVRAHASRTISASRRASRGATSRNVGSCKPRSLARS